MQLLTEIGNKYLSGDRTWPLGTFTQVLDIHSLPVTAYWRVIVACREADACQEGEDVDLSDRLPARRQMPAGR